MLDVETFLAAHFGDVENYQGTDLRVDCPHCGDNKKKMYVNSSTGVYHCWRCNESGTFYKLRKQLPEIFVGQPVILNRLVKRERRQTRKIEGMPPQFKKFKQIEPQMLLRHRGYKYISNRGISDSTIFEHEIGFCSKGRFSKRIMVPVFHNKELVSYLGRDYSGKADKRVLYDTRENVNPVAMYLYNFDEAKKYRSILVTEGWVDCLKSKQKVVGKGLGVVASFGKNLTTEQIDLLVEGEFDEIIFMWDLDAFDQQLEFASWLSEVSKVFFTRLGEQDPGELNEEDFFRYLGEREEYDPNKLYF